MSPIRHNKLAWFSDLNDLLFEVESTSFVSYKNISAILRAWVSLPAKKRHLIASSVNSTSFKSSYAETNMPISWYKSPSCFMAIHRRGYPIVKTWQILSPKVDSWDLKESSKPPKKTIAYSFVLDLSKSFLVLKRSPFVSKSQFFLFSGLVIT